MGARQKVWVIDNGKVRDFKSVYAAAMEHGLDPAYVRSAKYRAVKRGDTVFWSGTTMFYLTEPAPESAPEIPMMLGGLCGDEGVLLRGHCTHRLGFCEVW
ncbi:MAG: hypothetical protein A2001_01580 [Treponema sp. GWC1_61_84]|nr:MAG: hypothetical protein A2001_01580 [Treponema sp. GWC1_61_84]